MDEGDIRKTGVMELENEERVKFDRLYSTPERCLDDPADRVSARRLDWNRSMLIVRRSIANKTLGTKFGFIWLILDPLAISLVYLFVFAVIRYQEAPAVIFIGLGMLRGMQKALQDGASPASLSSMHGGFSVFRVRTRVPVTAMILQVGLDSFLMGIGITAVLITLDVSVFASFLFIPLLFISNMLWFGIGLFLLRFTSRVPDLNKILTYVSMGMFFASPVLYSLDRTTGIHRELNFFNPLTYAIEFSRWTCDISNGFDLLPVWGYAAIILAGMALLSVSIRKVDSIRWKFSMES